MAERHVSADLLFNREPVCPHCGYVASDAWEIGYGEEGDFDHDCGECGRPYRVSRHVTWSYSTEIPEVSS